MLEHHINKGKIKMKWKCAICNLIFDTRRKLESHKKEIHFGQAKCKFCGKIFDNCRKLGGHIISCKLNPKFKIIQKSKSEKCKKLIHKHSKATRELLSKIRSLQLDTSSAGFKDVKWYKVKNINGNEFVVRGHWEENVAKRLNELGILWIKNIQLKYEKDGIKKTYNPDFYLPKTKEFIEVKGYFSEKDKIKMQLVLQFNPKIRIFFIGQDKYFNFIDNGKLTDDLIFKGS